MHRYASFGGAGQYGICNGQLNSECSRIVACTRLRIKQITRSATIFGVSTLHSVISNVHPIRVA